MEEYERLSWSNKDKSALVPGHIISENLGI